MVREYFNTGLKPNLTIKETVKQEGISSKLLEYQECLENGTIFNLNFTRCNRETGDLYKDISGNEDRITIVMPSAESVTPATKNRRLATKLLLDYQVIVTSVDVENSTVTVSHRDAIKKLKNQLQRKINKELKREDRDKELEKIIVPAKVVMVNKTKNVVIVDIYGYGLPGYIPAANWQHLYTKDVGKFVTIGSVIDVEVLFLKASALGEDSSNMYCCSRKSLTPNPWKGIEERYHVKDIVRIKCVDKQRKHWFGTIDGLEGIQVFCEYPDESNNVTNVRIVLDREYQGYIYAVNEERMLLKARVFKEI